MTGRFSSAKGQIRSNKKRESRKSKASSSGCINIWKKVRRATAMYGYRPPVSQLTIAPQEHGVGQVRGKDGTREIWRRRFDRTTAHARPVQYGSVTVPAATTKGGEKFEDFIGKTYRNERRKKTSSRDVEKSFPSEGKEWKWLRKNILKLYVRVR